VDKIIRKKQKMVEAGEKGRDLDVWALRRLGVGLIIPKLFDQNQGIQSKILKFMEKLEKTLRRVFYRIFKKISSYLFQIFQITPKFYASNRH